MEPIFKHFDTRSPETKKLEEELVSVREALVKSIQDNQLACKHTHIAEAPWQHNEWSSSYPEQRICLSCGLAEEGWGIGFQTLFTKHPVKISRDELFQLRRGLFLDESKKAKLLRKEFTLAELIQFEDREPI